MILRNLEQRGITIRQIRSFTTLVDPFAKLFELTVSVDDHSRPGKINHQSNYTIKFSSYYDLASASSFLATALSNNATIYGESNDES